MNLIAALRDPACYPHPASRIAVLETHISWIILTGAHAYKIKKPVNLGFLDFRTLAARRHFCEEELRLNRRLAPALYETVVGITGTSVAPRVGGGGPAIEYAVQMREFPSEALANRLLAAGALNAATLDAFAVRIAAFHASAGVAACGSPYGAPQTIIASARENFTQITPLLADATDRFRLEAICTWTENEYGARLDLFTARQTQGCVRECHGDLHLGNIVMLDGALTPFDCIEFNPALRWIDVMSETAFLVMDLQDRCRTDLASRYLNAWLEETGDYAGLAVLRFYLAYRAMVRAKVHAMRAAQLEDGAAERVRLETACRHYLDLALRCTRRAEPALILMHGLSGSGKSMVAAALAEDQGAILLRSDIERKRLRGLAGLERSSSDVGAGLYTADATFATYNRLLDLARMITSDGYPVIVDATFLKRWQRELFRREARARRLPFVVVEVAAPEKVLRARIDTRLARGKDASEADQRVLTHQLGEHEPLAADELPDVLHVDTACDDVRDTASAACAALRNTRYAAEHATDTEARTLTTP